MQIPSRFLDTQQVAPETFLIRQLVGEGFNPVAVHMNTMVIRGAEPVIVDTGAAQTRADWLDRVFELVDPGDVRWVYLSHDDVDHTGNVLQVLEAAPKATLVTNWFTVERMAADYMLPIDRMRWVNGGESFEAGDRTLTAVVPPVFDSPTTRGLYDSRTGVYWAADALGAPVLHEVADVSELDPGFYREAFGMQQRMVSPWLEWADPVRYAAVVDRVRALNPSVIASCHGLALRGADVTEALDWATELPSLPAIEWPKQADLDTILAQLTGQQLAA